MRAPATRWVWPWVSGAGWVHRHDGGRARDALGGWPWPWGAHPARVPVLAAAAVRAHRLSLEEREGEEEGRPIYRA